MKQGLLENIISYQQKAPKTFLFIFLIFLSAFALIGSQLQIDPSFSNLVGKDSEYNTNDRMLSNAFDRNDGVIILVRESQTTTLTNAKKLSEIDDYFVTLVETINQSNYVKEIQGPYFSDDGRRAQFLLLLYAPERLDGFKLVLDELNSLVDQSGVPPGIEVRVTGLPILLDRIVTLLITDNLLTMLFTLVFIFIIFLLYARSFRFALITIIPPIVSLIILAALMVIFNIQVTLTLAAVGVIVLGIGADYSTHIATHYRDARRHHESHEAALLHTISELKVPIIASFFTTLGGFVALMFGVSPSSQSQGLVLSIAIIVIYFVSILLFPLLITLFLQEPGKPNPWMVKIQKFMVKFAILQVRRAKLVIFIFAILTIIMMVGASRVEFSTSNSNWIPDKDSVSKSFREVNYAFGDTEQLNILIISTKSDLRNVQTVRDINRLVASLEGVENIDIVVNPFEGVPYDSAAIYDYTENNPQFNKDYTLTTIRLVTSNPKQDEAGNSIFLSDVKQIISRYPVHNAQLRVHGDQVRFEEIGDSLEKDANVTTIIGLIIVFVVAATIYTSLTVGFLAMVPIIIAVIWSVGLMGWFNVPFTSLSTGIISLVLGVGVDFSIHLVDGIKRKISKGIEPAVTETLESAGSSILISSLTTFVGFIALTLAQLLGTRRLGWSLAFSIVAAFVVTISLVPAVLALTYNQKNNDKIKKKNEVSRRKK